MRLQKRDTYDSFDSWEHVCGRRWHEQNRNVSIGFAQENVWECRLFRVNTTAHGHIDGVARDPESEHPEQALRSFPVVRVSGRTSATAVPCITTAVEVCVRIRS